MDSRSPARVLVVAPDDAARDSLTLALGDVSDVIGVAGDGVPFELGAQNDDFDLIVWDEGATAAAAPTPRAGVPLLALVGDAERARAWLAGGARGALHRERDGGRVAAALAAMGAGLVVVDEAFGPALADASARGGDTAVSATPAPTLAEPLTAREQEVLELMAEGLSNKQIADALGFSSHTAKFHVNTLLAKLDAETRTEAVVRAVRLGVLAI
ncbi:MAG: response regulator transcription factor [Deltaproteobacteria bacterium]|nr:response regulator transcription factor [Deltaproteobacteria bacterium]